MSALSWLRRTFRGPPAPLLGPVFYYDLLRTARRGRYYIVRIAYILFLLLMLSWVYFTYAIRRDITETMPPAEAASFANSFFLMFMAIQFLVVVGVTPAYVAGAIAEEKERKTLEFLLATDLRDREIVLSKLASRVLNLMLLVITGLPILSALQFLGGIDPQLVLAGFAATLLTVASLSGLSIFNSVMCRRARDAVVMTYLMAIAYLGLSGLSWFLLSAGWGSFPSTDTWTSPVTLQDGVEWFNAGNIISVLVQLSVQVGIANAPISGVLPGYLGRYAVIHGAIALLGTLWALLRLRAVALREAGEAARSPRSVRLLGWRPVIGDSPMIWKEVFADRGPRRHWFARLIILLLIAASFAPVASICWLFLSGTMDDPSNRLPRHVSSWEEIAERTQIWVVGVSGTGVACLLLMAVAVRAAGSVSLERERQSLDGLLTTPLESKSILLGKWLGAVLSVRWGWLWLGALWGFGVVTGALNPVAFVLLVLSWFVYAAFLAALGLWFSCSGRATGRATTNTLLSALGAALGHWMIWMCCLPLLFVRGFSAGLENIVEILAKYQAGLTPPINLGVMSSFRLHADSSDMKSAGYGLLGTLTWLVLTMLLWERANRRFGRMTGREPSSERSPRRHKKRPRYDDD